MTSTTPTSPVHIAIIDDDPGIRRSMGMLLETRNWNSSGFERAADFLEYARPDSFHCLIIDIRIPDMSGLELFEILKRRTRSSHSYLAPALFLSGHGDIPMVVKALKQGACDFLEKPVDARTLLDAIARAVASDSLARVQHQAQTQLITEIAGLT